MTMQDIIKAVGDDYAMRSFSQVWRSGGAIFAITHDNMKDKSLLLVEGVVIQSLNCIGKLFILLLLLY